jgi:hypothetical protein
MHSFPVSPGLVLLAAAVVLAVGTVIGAGLALLGAWIWYTLRLVNRIERRGELYLSDWDSEQARKLKLAHDLATGLEFHRQALRMLDPIMAREFTREEPEAPNKQKGKKQ